MYFFVIMPIGADPKAHEKQAIIRRVADQAGLQVHMPTYRRHKPEFDLNSSVSDIKDAAFILADLSLERPSCYYELGLAEALSKRVFLVAENGTVIHQTAGRGGVRKFAGIDEYESLISSIVAEAVRQA